MSITITSIKKGNMRSAASILNQAFTYDFSKTGGAVGVINTGIQFPVNAQFVYAYVYATLQVTFAGVGSSIAVGTITTPTLIVPTTVVGAATRNPGNVMFSAVYAANTIRIMDGTLNVLLTIGTDAITAGKFNCIIEYTLAE